MSNEQLVTATQMVWRPKLIKLTMIGNPDWNKGEPSPCYLDPGVITSISKVVASFPIREDPSKKHPDVECTAVFFCHGTFHVLESPEEVAMLREKAYGQEPQIKAIK